MWRLAAWVALLGLAMPLAARAADEPAQTACHQQQSTLGLSECLQGLTAQWDRRLNAAYQAASKASESPARKEALLQAQRAWITYRDANCGWYGAQQGTIREVEAADCMLDMTRARAMELQQGR